MCIRDSGRTEVGGNHTDHNPGRVLAAGINLNAIAAASKNDENIVRVKSCLLYTSRCV